MGKASSRNTQEAVRWYRKAAEQGDAEAQNRLALLYLQDWFPGGANHGESMRWYRKAAEQGHVKAQHALGDHYASFGKNRNEIRAFDWYRKAAEQGDAEGQSKLGDMYYGGRGCIKSYREAARWYRKAAERNITHAQYMLGSMYEEGKGVVRNYKEAYKWLSIASALSYYEHRKKDMDTIEKKMTRAQIAAAQKEATEWLEAHKKRRP